MSTHLYTTDIIFEALAHFTQDYWWAILLFIIFVIYVIKTM